MQIEPQVILPLIYKITDPLDATVYFVRAVVYNSLSGVQIASKNLVSQGSGLYTSSLYAPADQLGTGFHIHIIISVYTDSGYTSFSDTYQQKVDKYLVKRTTPSFGGGGSGPDIDYDKIKKFIDDGAKLLKAEVSDMISSTKTTPININPVLAEIKALRTAFIEAGDAESTEDSKTLQSIQDSIERAVSTITAAVKAASPKATDPIDLEPLMAALEEIKSSVASLSTISEESKNSLNTAIKDLQSEVSHNYNADKKNALRDLSMKIDSMLNEPNSGSPEETVKSPKSPYMEKFFGDKTA